MTAPFISPPLALRMDDVGASTKRYNVCAKRDLSIGPFKISGHFLFLKYLPSFRAWGPYREISADEWLAILSLLEERGARMTVAVTACWAEDERRLIPFPEKFPRQAGILKDATQQGLIEIANHGLTHCVLKGNIFKPHWFSANRYWHREFWDWLPAEVHDDHIRRSQEVLERWVGMPVETLTPPGHQFSVDTLRAAENAGMRYLSCLCTPGREGRLLLLGEENTESFHDRDIVLYGVDWLRQLLDKHSDRRLVTVGDLGQWTLANQDRPAV